METRDRNFWSVRVSRDIRIIVHRIQNTFVLCYVDHHDEAYRWAARRKLEISSSRPARCRSSRYTRLSGRLRFQCMSKQSAGHAAETASSCGDAGRSVAELRRSSRVAGQRARSG